MRRGAVVEVDDAVGEGFGGEKLEADGSGGEAGGAEAPPLQQTKARTALQAIRR